MSPISDHPAETSTRDAVKGAIRAELDSLGDRLSSYRDGASGELERLAAFRWLTDLTGLRPKEVAERAGVSRQTLANLRSEDRGADFHWPPDLRVLLELALRGPKSAEDLVGVIAETPVSRAQVIGAVERLAADGLVTEASRVASGLGEPVVLWRLSAFGVEDLPRRLRHAAMPPSRAWTAYVVSSPAEANAIVAAGERALGERGVAMIPAGTVNGMDSPEVAFWVEAPDPRAAETAAIAMFRELRARAGMTPRQTPVVVSALIPPRRQATEH